MKIIVDKGKAFGDYLLSLSEKEYTLIRVRALGHFLSGPYECSKKGFQQYRKENELILTDAKIDSISQFLNFNGISTGRTLRTPKIKGKIVMKLDKISEKNKLRVSDFIRWCKTQYDYSEASIRLKSGQMQSFFSYFTEFNLENCRSYIATRDAEGVHPKTLNMYMLTFKQFGDYVKKTIKLKKISVPRNMSVENVPTMREYNKLLNWLQTNGRQRDYFIIKTLAMTGMRLSELFQVKWSDILCGEIFPKCKGKKRRVIYFPKSLIEEVRNWVRKNDIDTDEALLWSQRFQKSLTDRGFAQRLRMIATKAGFPLEKAHAHAFRHFFAKQFLAKTKDVIQLAELLGHESVDTTRLYLQRSKKEQMLSINKHIDW